MNEIIVSIIGFAGVAVPIIWQAYKFKRERDVAREEVYHQKAKLDIYEDILTIQSISKIGDAVSGLFEKTIADRYLILIGVEKLGKIKTVSVIFEQHKNSNASISAIARYKDVEIDDHYRQMVLDAEKYGAVNLETSSMKESKLRDWYISEGVTNCKVRFIHRKYLTSEASICCFCSISTHEGRSFSDKEEVRIKSTHDLIIVPLVKSILNDSEDPLKTELSSV